MPTTPTPTPAPATTPTATGAHAALDGPCHADPNCTLRADGDHVRTDAADYGLVDCGHCLPMFEVEFTVVVHVAAADEDAAYDKAHPIAVRRATQGGLNNYDDCVTRLDPGTFNPADLDDRTH